MRPRLLETPIDTEFARIVDELSRRGFLSGAAGTAVLLGLAACGGNQHSGDGDTRRVSSVNGPIIVPAHPKRVVTTDGFTMAAMFDLGFDPVGVYSAGEQYVEPQFVTRWRTIAKISDGSVGGAINVEKVATLKPDLILGIDGQKPPYGQLKAIGPTVILPFNASKAPWRDMAEGTADALGRASAFAKLKERYAARAAGIKRAYSDVLTSIRWDVLQGGFNQGQYWLYGPASPIGAILADAGVRFGKGSASVTGDHEALSYEQIGTLDDADAIFYYTVNDGKPANLGPQLFAQGGFLRLSAAKAGHLFGSTYFLPNGYSDAIGALDSLEVALEQLRQDLR